MDGQTERCAHCGTPATAGRYCTNCGAELGTEPTNPRVLPLEGDTAERVYDLPPAYVAPPARPPAEQPAQRPLPPITPHPADAEPAYLSAEPASPRGPGPGLWVAVVAVMLVVLLLGGFLLFQSSGGSDDGASSRPEVAPKTHRTPGPTTSAPTSSEPTASSSPATGPPSNVAGFAQASAPRHAPSGLDFRGRRVTYVAANLVDGRNDTCWRTPGDATGTELTFRLDQPTRISRVGLVNGYSKIAYSRGKAFDWYEGNRRVLSVEWLFDDGSSVSQDFVDDRNLQQIPVEPVITSVVRVRITAVSPPGKGRAARDDTAVSEVLLLGRTG